MNAILDMMMASDFPMCSVWGDQRIQIYNAAYNPIYGAKHPKSFGAPMRESWQEIWGFLEPAIDQSAEGRHDLLLGKLIRLFASLVLSAREA